MYQNNIGHNSIYSGDNNSHIQRKNMAILGGNRYINNVNSNVGT